MELDLEHAIATAEHAVSTRLGRHLSDVETVILKGAWHGLTYDQIADESGYSDSYLRRDVGTKFWRSLSQALGETVSKTSFREALRRYLNQYEIQNLMNEPSPTPAEANGTSENGINGVKAEHTVSIAETKSPSMSGPQSEFYVVRSPLDTICHDTLLQPGALVRLKAPSLMGKTTLMDHVLSQLATEGLRTVSLSLKLADRQSHFSNLNRFLRWLCINITRSLSRPNHLDDYWDEEGMGSKVSCSTYVEEVMLADVDTPLVLCLDDIDLLFPYPEIYEDFFALLRSWYEMARTRSRPLWKRLRLAIVHSTDVYIPLNMNQSPFNVGVPIELTEFTAAQVQQFAQQHGLSASLDLTPLMEMVGGHPYLLERAFGYLNTHPDSCLAQLLAEATVETGLYGSHLRQCWLKVRDSLDLTDALGKIMTSETALLLDSVQAYQLHSMGLITLMGNRAKPRCQLYRHYFQTQLGARNG